MGTPSPDQDGPGAGRHSWRAAPIVAVAVLVLAAGFGQFSAIAALGDVAEAFGTAEPEGTIAEQAGLSGTVLGIGLAIIRLASLGALPLAGLADVVGRRLTLLTLAAVGLALTAAAALSPGYWWFVALFALSRPCLTATDTVAEVYGAEHTATPERAKAIAFLAAAYGVGSGLIAVIHGVGSGVLGFRGVFAVALVPLLAVAVASRRLTEPDRYRSVSSEEKPIPVLGAVGRRHRRRLGVVVVVTFAVAMVTGPANSFIFLYSENVLGLSSLVTAGMVVAAGPVGLAGLLAGRWGADRVGRRVTAGVGLALVAAAGVVTYAGAPAAAIAGYLGAVTAGSVFAPAAGAFVAELFPTEVRAAAVGWSVTAGVLGAVAGLMAFGALADATGAFSTAALLVFVPAVAAAALLPLLPETKDRELEDWAER